MTLSSSGTWQRVSEMAAFQALRDEWGTLFASNPKHRPFQSWSWVTAWMRHLAGEHELCIICLRGEDGQLQFLLPLVRSTRNGKYRSMRLSLACGYGPECSDHLGALRLPRFDADAAALAAEGIVTTCDRNERIELDGLDGHDNFSAMFGAEIGRVRRNVAVRRLAACPVAPLERSWDAYLQTLSSNFRSQVRRHSRRVTQETSLTLRPVDAADADQFTRELIRLNRSRIGDKGAISSLENARFRDFLADVVPQMVRDGLAWMDILEHDDAVVGAALNLVHGKTVYYYLGGFAESAQKFRPGTVLFAHVMQRAIEHDFTYYDFLRGAEPYKYRWAAVDKDIYQVTVYPQEILRGLLASRADKWHGNVRQLVRKVTARASRK